MIGVDFQAHGRTADIDRDLTYANLASDVVGLLDHFGIERAHVIGHSMGGGTALELAVNHSDRLLSVVPISASVRPEGDAPGPGRSQHVRHLHSDADRAGLRRHGRRVRQGRPATRSGSTSSRSGR